MQVILINQQQDIVTLEQSPLLTWFQEICKYHVILHNNNCYFSYEITVDQKLY